MAVTYVPDSAPVRQKMLFAATRLTFTRELGTEHFRDTVFTTTADELTEAGFKKHDAHEKLEAPLTQEEQTLGEVKRAEQEAGQGTGVREIHLSKSLNMPVTEDAIAAMKEVGQEGRRVVVMLVSFLSWTVPSLANRRRKSIPTPRSSNWYPNRPAQALWQSWRKSSPRQSRASPSTASHTRTRAQSRARSCSSTPAP